MTMLWLALVGTAAAAVVALAQREAAVVTEPFTLDGGAYRAFALTVPDAVENVRVAGRFSVNGEIELYLFDEEGFRHFKEGRLKSPVYQSGRVATGTVNLALGPGTYHLVFSNRFALAAAKSVDARVVLRYE